MINNYHSQLVLKFLVSILLLAYNAVNSWNHATNGHTKSCFFSECLSSNWVRVTLDFQDISSLSYWQWPPPKIDFSWKWDVKTIWFNAIPYVYGNGHAIYDWLIPLFLPGIYTLRYPCRIPVIDTMHFLQNAHGMGCTTYTRWYHEYQMTFIFDLGGTWEKIVFMITDINMTMINQSTFNTPCNNSFLLYHNKRRICHSRLIRKVKFLLETFHEELVYCVILINAHLVAMV